MTRAAPSSPRALFLQDERGKIWLEFISSDLISGLLFYIKVGNNLYLITRQLLLMPHANGLTPASLAYSLCAALTSCTLCSLNVVAPTEFFYQRSRVCYTQ